MPVWWVGLGFRAFHCAYNMKTELYERIPIRELLKHREALVDPELIELYKLDKVDASNLTIYVSRYSYHPYENLEDYDDDYFGNDYVDVVIPISKKEYKTPSEAMRYVGDRFKHEKYIHHWRWSEEEMDTIGKYVPRGMII